MDHVIAVRGSRLYLPARKEGIIPGASNLRLPRFVGDRAARQAILSGREWTAGDPDADLICDEVVEPGEIDAAIDGRIEALTSSGLINAAANRAAMRVGRGAGRPVPRVHGHVRPRAGVLPPEPGARPQPRAALECRPSTRLSRDLGRRAETMPREQLARAAARAAARDGRARARAASRSGRRGWRRPESRRPRTCDSLDDLARRPVRPQDRPARELSVRSARGPARGARARPGLERQPRQADRRRIHARRPRDLDRADGALDDDGRRAPRDADPQRQRLRPVHGRARLPPGRRADRRHRGPGVGRLHRAPGDAAARSRRAGARRDPVVLARDRPGAAGCRRRPGDAAARARAVRRRAVDRGTADRDRPRARDQRRSTSTACRRCAARASRPSA